ncbi:MAG: type II toxin-antitoxin system Phd/YefM family antitoxin [Chloroflexi bacterium]|nr:type II toxin-antitoxin system Phd/YefM family antitoxin [Chloroflexota bacterium]
MVKTVSLTEMKAHLSEYAKDAEESPVVLTRNGKPVAILLHIDNPDNLERLLMAYSPKLQRILEESKRQIAAGEVLSEDEFWQQVEEDYDSSDQGGAARHAKSKQ